MTYDMAWEHFITPTGARLDVQHVMRENVLTITSHATVVEAAAKMAANQISCLIVADDQCVVGVVTETDLLRKVAASPATLDHLCVREIMSSPVVSVSPAVSVLEASRIMRGKQIKRLPVLVGDELVGVITQTDLTRALTSLGMWKNVIDIMVSDVVRMDRKATARSAAQAMVAHHISCVIVQDGDETVGILTERDFLERVVACRKDPNEAALEDIMSAPLISVQPQYSVFSASELMETKNIRRLAVVEDGRLCGIVAQTDIFRSMQRKLEEEEKRNLRLLEKSENAVFTADMDENTLYVNPAFLKLFDVDDAAEFVGRPLLPEPFWPNALARAEFFRDLHSGESGAKELTLKTASGSQIHVTLFSTFTTNAYGELCGSQGILYDVTAKKELVALRKAEEALRLAQFSIDHAADATFWIAPDAKFIYVNNAACRTLEYSQGELLSMTMHDIGPNFPAEVWPGQWEDFRRQGAVTIESVLRTKAGRVFPVEMTVNYLQLSGREYVSAFARDITERKRAEQELTNRAAILEVANRELE